MTRRNTLSTLPIAILTLMFALHGAAHAQPARHVIGERGRIEVSPVVVTLRDLPQHLPWDTLVPEMEEETIFHEADNTPIEERLAIMNRLIPVGEGGGRWIRDGSVRASEKSQTHVMSGPTIDRTFNGLSWTGWYPPDVTLAANGRFVVQATNASLRVTDTGGTQQSSTTLLTFFSSVSPARKVFDPKVAYDADSNRFIVLADAIAWSSNDSSQLLVAVSQTSDPTGSWNLYKFDATIDGTTSTTNWCDYPGLGYDDEAIYLTGNMYSSTNSFRYAKVRILDKARMYAGQSVTWFDFWNMTNSNNSTVFTIKPAQSFGQPGGEYLLNTNAFSANWVTLWKITSPLATTPTMTRQATLSVGSYSAPPQPTQSGGCNTLDAGDCRTEDVVWRDSVLYTAWTIGTNWGSGNEAAIKLLKVNTTTSSLIRNITYGAQGYHYFYPNVAVDGCGRLYMVFHRSSSNDYSGVRAVVDPWIDSVSTGSHIGTACYNISNSRNRWGDYSGIYAAPDGNVWLSGEIASAGNRWATKISSIAAAAGGGTPLSVQASSDAAVCNGDTTTISVTASGGQGTLAYQWTPAAGLSAVDIASPYAAPTTTTTYRVAVSDACGDVEFDSVTVSVNPLPQPAISGPTDVCARSVVDYSTQNDTGAVYAWLLTGGQFVGPTDSSTVSVQWGSAGTGTLQLTERMNASGCEATTPTRSVTINPLPTADAGSDTVVCSATPVTIGGATPASGGSGGYSFLWRPATGLSSATVANPMATVASTTTYVLTVVDSRGCSDVDSMTITINPDLVADAGQDRAVCPGTATVLGTTSTGSGGDGTYTYAWAPSTGLNATDIANPVASPATTSSYVLTVTDGLGCMAVDTIVITVDPPLHVDAGPDREVCAGEPIDIGADQIASGGSGTYSYQWSPAADLTSAYVAHPTARPQQTTNYVVRVSDAAGCVAFDTVTVRVSPTMTIDAGQDKALCAGEKATIGGATEVTGGTPPFDYQWAPSEGLDDATSEHPTAGPSGTTTYYLTVTDSKGCTAADSVTVTRLTAIAVQLTPSGTVSTCQGDSVTIEAPGGFASYRWTNGATSRRITVADSGTYAVSVTTASGCSATSDSLVVSMLPTPPRPTVTRVTDTLVSSAADTYQWFFNGNPISGANDRWLKVSEDGTYFVRVENEEGCSSTSDSLTVIVARIAEIGVSDFSVRPNPTTGMLQVEATLTGAMPVEISLINVYGERLMHVMAPRTAGMFTHRFDLGDLPSGIYLLEIRTDKGRWLQKVVRQ